MMFRYIIFLCFIVLLMSCDRLYTYKKVSKDKLRDYELKIINETSKVKCFVATKDVGPPTNTQSFLVVNIKDNFYKINPDYHYSIYNDTILLLSEKYITKPNYEGNWIYVDRVIDKEHEEVMFKYDTIPDIKDTVLKNDEGVYFFRHGDMQKVGTLTEFKSLHQLSQKGFYYLSPPGIFYKKKIELNKIN